MSIPQKLRLEEEKKQTLSEARTLAMAQEQKRQCEYWQ